MEDNDECLHYKMQGTHDYCPDCGEYWSRKMDKLKVLRVECERLRARIAELEVQRDALKQQAETWAQEARTQKSTVHEIYRLCTGGTGEPGDWHGAEPVRALIARIADLEADAERYQVQKEHALDEAATAKRVAASIEHAKTVVAKWKSRAERVEAENIEQARLLGMSAEREVKLLAELAAAKADAAKARVAFFEMYRDWTGGDFDLPPLAAIDIESIRATYEAIDKARGAA